jgi:hypothetical protein
MSATVTNSSPFTAQWVKGDQYQWCEFHILYKMHKEYYRNLVQDTFGLKH